MGSVDAVGGEVELGADVGAKIGALVGCGTIEYVSGIDWSFRK